MAESTPLTKEYLQTLVDVFKHCKILGIRVHDIAGKKVSLELPYSEKIIGNPETGIIAGGALTTLLDTTFGLAVFTALEGKYIAPTLDLRIDYMTSARPGQTLYSEAEVYRITQNVVFCRGIAYYDDQEKPLAHCVATFMPLPVEVTGVHL